MTRVDAMTFVGITDGRPKVTDLFEMVGKLPNGWELDTITVGEGWLNICVKGPHRYVDG